MTKIQSETKSTFVGPNTDRWSLGRTKRRVGGQLDVENKPVLAELARQKQIVDKLKKDPKMVAFLEANPDLKLENFLESTNFQAADGKTYDIKNILSSYKNAAGKIENKEWDLKTEAAADAAAVLQTQLINIAQRAAKVPETKFSSDPKVLRGDRGEYTKRNPKWGQLDKFLMSKDAEKIGFINIKGECRGQTTEQMTRMRVDVPAPEKPFSYLSNHPKFTEDGQAETMALETSTTGSIPPSSSLSEDKQEIDFPSHRRRIPVIIPTIDLFFKGCPIGCDGGGLIPST